MEIKFDGPFCTICRKTMQGRYNCNIYPLCGHSFCDECSADFYECRICKYEGAVVKFLHLEEVKDENDLVCQNCEVWFGDKIFYPVFIKRGREIICDICWLKSESVKAKPVKFFSLALFSSQMKLATQRKLETCPHSIDNHVYCLVNLVHFCKLCCYNSFSIHKGHKLLFGDDIRKEEEKELTDIKLLFDKEEKEGIIGYLSEFARFTKDLVAKVSGLVSKSEEEIFAVLDLDKEPVYEEALIFNERFEQLRSFFEQLLSCSEKRCKIAQLKYIKEKLYVLLAKSNEAFVCKGRVIVKFRQFYLCINSLHEKVKLDKNQTLEFTNEFLEFCKRPVTHFVREFLTQVKPSKNKKDESLIPTVQPFNRVSHLIPKAEKPQPIDINTNEDCIDPYESSDEAP